MFNFPRTKWREPSEIFFIFQGVEKGKLVWNELVSVFTQLTFTCSKPTTETLEKGAKYVRS